MNETAHSVPIKQFLSADQSLACIHCGLCLSSCPTYLETGNENDSPRGRIYQMRAVEKGGIPLSVETVRHFDLCLGCRACESACPSGVQYGSLLESTREYVEKNHRRGIKEHFLRRVLIEQIFPYTRRVNLALKPVQMLKWMGLDRLLPKSLRRFTSLVPDHMIARRPLPVLSPSVAKEKLGTVGFVSGCVMDVMFNRTNWNSIHLLNLAGYDVVTPKNQGCCGALHSHSGNLGEARSKARSLIDLFSDHDLDHIVINAAGCGSALKEYGHLLTGDEEYGTRAKAFGALVTDLSVALAASQTFIDLLKKSAGGSKPDGVVTYHDACHLAHAQGVVTPPRELLKLLGQDHFVELPESDVCCGSAGSYNLTESEMADRLQKRKIDNLKTTHADVVVTSNPGCLLQIESGIRRWSSERSRVVHIADYLADCLQNRSRA